MREARTGGLSTNGASPYFVLTPTMFSPVKDMFSSVKTRSRLAGRRGAKGVTSEAKGQLQAVKGVAKQWHPAPSKRSPARRRRSLRICCRPPCSCQSKAPVQDLYPGDPPPRPDNVPQHVFTGERSPFTGENISHGSTRPAVPKRKGPLLTAPEAAPSRSCAFGCDRPRFPLRLKPTRPRPA